MSEPNLQELWEDKAEQERSGYSPEERDFKIFERMSRQAEANEDLKDYFNDLKNAISRYSELVVTYERNYGTEIIEEIDEARLIAHNALIDKLNILSREFAKAGLDSSWRRDIGDSREQVSEWAMNVTEMLKQNK